MTFLGKDWTKDSEGPVIPDFLNVSAAPRLWKCWPSTSRVGHMTKQDVDKIVKENPDGI